MFDHAYGISVENEQFLAPQNGNNSDIKESIK